MFNSVKLYVVLDGREPFSHSVIKQGTGIVK